jgi:hypothetical protein
MRVQAGALMANNISRLAPAAASLMMAVLLWPLTGRGVNTSGGARGQVGKGYALTIAATSGPMQHSFAATLGVQ